MRLQIFFFLKASWCRGLLLQDKLKDKWAGVDTKYDEKEEMLDASIIREKKVQASGVDEALNYMDMQSLRSLLGEK